MGHIKNMFNSQFTEMKKFEYDWEKIRLSEHFLKRFNDRHTDKFSKEDLKDLLKNESSSWEFIIKDKEGVEFWQRHNIQCYLFDVNRNTLVTTYVLDFNGFENDFGKGMIYNLFKEFDRIKEKNILLIKDLENKTIGKFSEVERLEDEICLLEKRKNIIKNGIENDIREKDALESEIYIMGQHIVKNRNFQTYKLISK